MKYFYWNCFFLLFFFTASAQNSNNKYILNLPNKTSLNDTVLFLNEAFQRGNLNLFGNQKLSNCLFKLDLSNNLFEIFYWGQSKILDADKVQDFTIENDSFVYINARFFKIKNKRAKGFVKVFYDGKTKVLQHLNVVKIPPDYNIPLHVGNKNVKYKLNLMLYFSKDQELIRIRKSKKKNLVFFEDQAKLIEKYMNQNNLSFQKVNDLIKIMEYFESL